MTDHLLTSWMTRLDRWVRLHPVAGSRAHMEIAEELATALAACGLAVTRYAHASGDLLVARGAGAGPRLGMYGHYDVEPGGRTTMRVADNRVFGRGVADNLGPLALRLSILERQRRQPHLLWVIEPGEETGSRALADWLGQANDTWADLWLDETGYFDASGEQRFLTVDADERVERVVRQCATLAAPLGISTRTEARRLHRVGASAGFSVESLFHSTPYLALGPNDDSSDVHGDQESLPLNTIDLSMRQFEALLDTLATENLR